MEKLVVIDGNSILNRAFYGIMGSKMLQTSDGTYTNAVYGFLAIMFKMLEDINPNYLVVAFDVKSPTKRHELYKDYKGTRKGMPDELAEQMPIIKRVLTAMNIKIIEKAGYEADDILGTLANFGESEGLEVTLLTGDRDSFQLATDKVTIRIPHTKQGKTEVDNYDRTKVLEVYGVEPKALIEVKGLMGDSSDNIPGVAGIGEKTALNLIKSFGTIEEIYKKIDEGEPTIKGKVKEKLLADKEMAFLSKTLGTIDTNAPIDKDLSDFKLKDWNKNEVLKIFRELRFNRYIQRFNLTSEGDIGENITKETNSENELEESKNGKIELEDLFKICKIQEKEKLDEIFERIFNDKIVYYFFEKKDTDEVNPISKKIISVKICIDNIVYSVSFEDFKNEFKNLFENDEILKCGYEQKIDYILLKQEGIEPKNLMFDVRISAYLLNSNSNQYDLENLAYTYLELDINELLKQNVTNEQTSLFETSEEKENTDNEVYAYVISKLKVKLEQELEKIGSLKLFNEIEMPLVEVLAEMQFTGMYADEKEIMKFGNSLKSHLEELRIDIYNLAGGEFNINSTKQLGEILFEKLRLPVQKKTKSRLFYRCRGFRKIEG